MLEKLLMQEKQKLEARIGRKEDILKQKTELEERVSGLQSNVDEIDGQMRNLVEKLNLIKQKKEHPAKSFFSGKGKQIKKIKDELSQLNMRFNEAYEEYKQEETIAKVQIGEYEAQLQDIEDAEQQIQYMDNDPEYGIKRLIKEHPELLENEGFVLDLIDINMGFIAVDKTDSEKVYSKLLSKACDVLKGQIKQYEGVEHFRKLPEDINYVLEELEKPHLVPDHKYKIPHQFLIEALKRGIQVEVYNELPAIKSTERMAERFSTICGQYRKLDGKMSQASGKKMEELYLDDETDIYFHCPWGTEEERIKIIQETGLKLRAEYHECMNRTTVSQNQMEGYFLNFLGTGANVSTDTMILSIPKKDTMILGNHAGENDDKYILPEYIIGRLTLDKDGEIEFIENAIPANERTVYEHKYYGVKTNEIAGKILPITAMKNALSQGITVEGTKQAAKVDVEALKEEIYDRRRRVTKDD